jgi:hypothetical protein
MSRRRIASAGLLAPLVASLLILGIVATELPELVSLVDDTSNDFVVRNASHKECAPAFTSPSHSFLQPEINHFRFDARQERATSFVVAELDPSELFLLHSVLRR